MPSDVHETMQELTRTLQSLNALADYLERHPELLVFGNKGGQYRYRVHRSFSFAWSPASGWRRSPRALPRPRGSPRSRPTTAGAASPASNATPNDQHARRPCAGSRGRQPTGHADKSDTGRQTRGRSLGLTCRRRDSPCSFNSGDAPSRTRSTCMVSRTMTTFSHIALPSRFSDSNRGQVRTSWLTRYRASTWHRPANADLP